ncbi:MAG TPA: hypothetical protein VGP68_11615 [Gemmataceae bacterium]|nr:hypothetical protein [Gemmataceae bacterium]
MAKKESSEETILNALRKAVAELPNSLPIVGKDGLFPGGAKGKELFEQAVSNGYLRVREEKVKVGARSKKVLKGLILEQGIQKVIQTDSPKAALEALLPALESLGKRPPPPDIEAFRHELNRATKTCLDAMTSAFSKLESDVLKTIQPSAVQPALTPEAVISAVHQAIERVKPIILPAAFNSGTPESSDVAGPIQSLPPPDAS